MKWLQFHIALDRQEGIFAETQILCRLSNDEGNRLPVNRFKIQEGEDARDDLIPLPIRGDVYLLGRTVLDDGTYKIPPQIKFYLRIT